MTQQPGQEWPQENPYAAGAGQPPAYPEPTYPQAAGYPQQAYPQPGYQQAPAYPQAAGYPQAPAYPAQGYGAAGYSPTPALPPLAHWGKRVAAMLLDGLLMGVPIGLGGILMATSVQVTGYDIYGREVAEPTGAGVAALIFGYLVGFGLQLWNRWVRQGRTGRSLGKQALGITLVSERTMAPVGAGMAFARDLCHVADGFFYLGYLWPLWDAKRQTFADKIVSTVVLDG